MDQKVSEIFAKLAEPFPLTEISWKPQATTAECDKAMAVAYIDARNVMDRLDAVVGPHRWRDRYTLLPSGQVQCTLDVWVHDYNSVLVKVTHEDVGGQSDQPDPGDKMKAAYSDALKRAAVKLGIGRYLYGLDNVWYRCSNYKDRSGKLRFKDWLEKPRLPDWALPKGTKQPTPSPPPQAQPPAAAPSQPQPNPPAKAPPQAQPPAKPGQVPMATKDHVDQLDQLFKIAVDEAKVWTWDLVNERLKTAAGKADPWALTAAQAENIITATSKFLRERGVELPKT